MREVALGRVVDDVGQRQIERLVAELQRIRLFRLLLHLVEEQRINRGRFLADQPRQRGAFGAVALAGGAQAAEEVNLEAGRLGQLVGRQLRATLIKVVGDAHRPDRVRARGAGTHLVELLDHGHHRALGPFHDVQSWRHELESSGGIGTSPPLPSRLAAARASGVHAAPVITAAAPMTALRMRKDRRLMPAGIADSAGTPEAARRVWMRLMCSLSVLLVCSC